MMSDRRRLASVLAIAGGMFLTAAAQAQTTWYVDNGNCPGPGSGSEGDPFCMIQDGIEASASGDEVIVADGTYTGDGNRDLDFGGRDIHLRSESLDPELCIINCQGSEANPHRGFFFHSGETLAAIVEGFTITGGYMAGATQADNRGGAFYIEAGAATIRHCVFTDNTVNHVLAGLYGGGALSAVDATLDISDCVFSQNSSTSVQFTIGGAINAVSSTLTFVRCTMANNTATGPAGGAGGAASIFGVSTWIDCIVADNTASTTGGLNLQLGPHVLQGCEITGNHATNQHGGGLAADGTLEDCLIANNSADIRRGGFSASVIRNSTIRDNHAGQDFGGGSFGLVENCVIAGNTTSGYGIGGVLAGTVSGCLIMGNSSGGVPFFGLPTAGGVSASLVIDCIVVGNTSTLPGGGIHARSEVVNCLVLGNSAPRAAGILARDSDARIVNCTVVGNSATVAGGGVASLGDDSGHGNTAMVSNSIVWGNSAPVGAQLAALDFMGRGGDTHPSELTLEYTDSQGGQAAVHVDPLSTLIWGLGNIDVDPLFVDADGPDDDPETWEDNNYRLQADSLCIDAGDNEAVPPDSADLDDDGDTDEPTPFDLDGNARIVDGDGDEEADVDMGAYEFQTHGPCPWDLNGDGEVGPFDLALVLGFWGPNPGHPSDINGDGEVGPLDLALVLGNWGPCE